MRIKKKRFKFYLTGTLLGFFFTYISNSVASCAREVSSNVKLLVSNYSSTLADKSFSESAFIGVKSFFNDVVYAQDLDKQKSLPDAIDLGENAGFWRVPGITDAGRFQACVSLADEGNIVLLTGFNQQKIVEWITDITEKNKKRREMTKDKGFIFIDGNIGTKDGLDDQKQLYTYQPLNVSSIEYKCDDSSFIGGIALSVFLNKQYMLYPDFFKEQIKNANQYFGINSNDRLPGRGSDLPMGTIGVSSFVGMALPATLDYMNGLRLGIAYFNSKLEEWYNASSISNNSIFEKGWLPISFIGVERNSDGKGLDIKKNFMSGDFDTNNTFVSNLISNYYKNGSVAVLPIAGPQTNLVVTNIRDQKRSMLCIGVDTEQENDPQFDYQLPGGEKIGSGKILQFSFLKNIKESVKQVLWSIYCNNENDYSEKAKYINGKPNTNGYGGFGWTNKANFMNRGTGISENLLDYYMSPDGLGLSDIGSTVEEKEQTWIKAYTTILSSSLSAEDNWVIKGDEFYPTDKSRYDKYIQRYKFDKWSLIPMLFTDSTNFGVSYPTKDFETVQTVAVKYRDSILSGHQYDEVKKEGWNYYFY